MDQKQQSENPFGNPGSYADTGWRDVLPVAATSSKKSATFFGPSRWAQWRLYPDGVVRFRGSIERNSGAFSSGDVVGTIPPGLFHGPQDHIVFPQNVFLGLVRINNAGNIQWQGDPALLVYLDSCFFIVDP